MGYFYVDKTQKSPKIRELVRSHLIDKHLLDSNYFDPEEILRLGEGHYASELFVMSRKIIKQSRDLQREFYEADRTGNTKAFE